MGRPGDLAVGPDRRSAAMGQISAWHYSLIFLFQDFDFQL
jgi:hypothetical protein